MSAQRAYEEVVDFIAGANPGEVVAFEPSEAAKEHVADLIWREKMEGLTPDETSELEHYLQIEHLMASPFSPELKSAP